MYMRGWGETYDSSLIMFLIEGGESPILVDTGPGSADEVWRNHHYRLEQNPNEVPMEALRRANVDPADVKIVINTHLHWDHCSNNKEFPNAKILIQRDELNYAVTPLEWNRVAFDKIPGVEPAWYSVWHQIEVVDGDAKVAPGVSIVSIPGHTPGSQGVLVETDGGRYLIAGDCIPLYENWHGDANAAHIPDGLYYDLGVYAQTFRKIEDLDCEIIPSHDPAVVDRGIFR
jgi:N-acyl homoserine lactone hydrolase